MQLIEFGTIMNMVKGKKPANQSQENQDGFLPYVDIKAFETQTVENYADGEKCLPCNEGDILMTALVLAWLEKQLLDMLGLRLPKLQQRE